MKILIATPIYPPEIGGPARYTQEITKRLADKHEFEVITFTENPKVSYISQKGGTIIRQLRLFVAIWGKAQKNDLIYVLDPLVMGLVCLIVAKILRKKIILRYGGDPTWEAAFGSGKTSKLLVDFLNHPDAGLGSKVVVYLAGLVFRNVNKVIANCRFLKNVAVNQYGADPNKVVVIYNAVDISEDHKVYRKKKKYAVLSFGRLVSWKNYEGIIEAVELVNSRSKVYVELTISGSGPEKDNLERLAKKHPYIKIIEGLSRSEVIRLLGKSDVYVLNSSFEGSPHQVLEAFSVGTPVVATNIPGTDEVAINNMTALTVEVDDPAGLSKAIEKILSNPKLAQKLATNAKFLLQREYSWKKSIGRLNQVLNPN